MTTTEIEAPAKINLFLQVNGRRPDGYHELGMIMQRVSLCDRLTIARIDAPVVRVTCPGLPLADGEENIAARAARRMLARAGGAAGGVEIVIDKRIPVAAGLGGGSSDAAAVLQALDAMLDLRLDRDELLREGVRLGADVPFFLFGQSAWATGIGEVLTPYPLPPAWYLLINPGLAVSTAWVYGNLRLTSLGAAAKMPKFPQTVDELAGLLHNDLESVTVSRYPLLAGIKEELLAAGASGALMSGSGPTVFGLFDGAESAQNACADLRRQHPDWRLFLVEPLPDVGSRDAQCAGRLPCS